ncbi:MAG: hypothetical protein IPN76_30200 [Saprospiraceae bacterium]|nr:hypothetical protein [Saprospiraceae bacterium]
MKSIPYLKKIQNIFGKIRLRLTFRIYGADRVSSLINEFNKDEFLLKMAIAFNESKTTSYFTLAGRIKAKEGNLGSGQGWHRDTPNPYQFKALIYLTDVEMDNGPFEIIEGTQEPNSMFDGIWKANMMFQQHRMSEGEIENLLRYPKFKTKTFTAKAGTVILVSTFAIHRGMPINLGERYALTNYYFQDFTVNPIYIEKKFNLPPKKKSNEL